MNNDIINKVLEIKEIIETSELYKKYILLKNELNNDNEIKILINKIKLLQKDIAHNINKKNELEKLNIELNDNPLYREYTNTVIEINNIYSNIENTLNKYFNNTFN